MNKPAKNDDASKMAESNAPEPQAKQATANANENGEAAPAGAAPVENDLLAEREAEIADLKSKVLLTLADMENLRRRTEREVADARKFAVSNFARDMLTVGDNLRRALDSIPSDVREGGDATLTALVEGVEVTERSLEQTMLKFGVKEIEAKGEKFDPEFHQAMMEVENADATPGTVADVIQTGYVIGERVLRPAFVSVVKKVRPKPAAEKPAAEADAAPGQDDSGEQ